MIKEVSIIKAFDDYREAMNYTKTILEDVVLLTLHGENGKKLHGPVSKTNIKEILDLFKDKEWQGLTDEEKLTIVRETDNPVDALAATEAKLKEKNT